LEQLVALDRIVIYARSESGQVGHPHIRVLVAGEDGDPQCADFTEVYRHDGSPWYGVARNAPLVVHLADQEVTARMVRLQVPGNVSFALDEVEVYAVGAAEENIALGKPADQISVSDHSYPGTIPYELGIVRYPRHFRGGPSPAGAVAGTSGGPFSLAHTAQVLDRATELIERLEAAGDGECWQDRKDDLEKLADRLAVRREAEEVAEDPRKKLYFDARRLLRRIALANPLLGDIDRLLFIKRHDDAPPSPRPTSLERTICRTGRSPAARARPPPATRRPSRRPPLARPTPPPVLHGSRGRRPGIPGRSGAGSHGMKVDYSPENPKSPSPANPPDS